MLLFVSPDNPSGAVYPPEQVAAIGRWAVERGVWVITDEIYEHLTYGPHEFTSMPVLVPDIADQCIIVNGVAKTYAMTGWRVGWMIAPPDVTKAATNFQSHATSNVSNVAQRAALAAVGGDLEAVAMMRDGVRAPRQDDALDAVGDRRRHVPRAAGRVLLLPERRRACSGASIRGRTCTTTLELADLVLSEAKVAFVPGEAFGAPGYARFSFALGDDDLAEGITRIARSSPDLTRRSHPSVPSSECMVRGSHH